MHPDLRVFGPNEWTIRGTRFRFVTHDYDQYHTKADEVIILKSLPYFKYYGKLISNRNLRTLLELGIFEGGSAIFFALLFEQLRIVGVDFRAPDPHVLDHISKLELTDRVRLHYRTPQDDRDGLNKILTAEFGEEPICMVVDDASHQYAESRASFEILFPRLRPGGVYIIEDWAWAHWQGMYQDQQWIDKPALSNLVFELTMLAGSRSDLVEKIVIRPGTVALFKQGQATLSEFKLNGSYLTRGNRPSLI